MSEPVISIEGVSRSFGSTQAVDDLTLQIEAGSICGLLGTNGAGKTTLLRMIAGHLHCDRGQVRVLGRDPWGLDSATLQRIAYVSDSVQLPPRMKIRQALQYNHAFFPQWNHELEKQLLEKFQVSPNKRYSQLSFGQRRRVMLLQALCQQADLLILDEPAGGLDALARRQFLDQLLASP